MFYGLYIFCPFTFTYRITNIPLPAFAEIKKKTHNLSAFNILTYPGCRSTDSHNFLSVTIKKKAQSISGNHTLKKGNSGSSVH